MLSRALQSLLWMELNMRSTLQQSPVRYPLQPTSHRFVIISTCLLPILLTRVLVLCRCLLFLQTALHPHCHPKLKSWKKPRSQSMPCTRGRSRSKRIMRWLRACCPHQMVRAGENGGFVPLQDLATAKLAHLDTDRDLEIYEKYFLDYRALIKAVDVALIVVWPVQGVYNPIHLDLGGNVKKCVRMDARGSRDATIFLNIPPSQRGHPKIVCNSTATVTTMAAHRAEIRTQETVFVKWGMDKDRVKALRHEARFYANDLRHLQGTVVPRLIGYYESTNKNEYFAVSIFEHCSGGIPADNAEYHRQYMIAACAIHAAGVTHGQLAEGYTEPGRCIDHHVFFDRHRNARIVDFTRATRHDCSGAPLHVPGTVRKGKYCEELLYLETVIGDRLTGRPAKDTEKRRKQRKKTEHAQYVRYKGGPALSYIKT